MDDAIKLHWPRGGGDKPDPNRPLGVDFRTLDSGPRRVPDWDLDPPGGVRFQTLGPYFPGKMRSGTWIRRRNAVLTSQTPPKRGSGMVRMGKIGVQRHFLPLFGGSGTSPWGGPRSPKWGSNMAPICHIFGISWLEIRPATCNDASFAGAVTRLKDQVVGTQANLYTR